MQSCQKQSRDQSPRRPASDTCHTRSTVRASFVDFDVRTHEEHVTVRESTCLESVREWSAVQPIAEQGGQLCREGRAVQASQQRAVSALEVQRTHATAPHCCTRQLRRREFDLAQGVAVLFEQTAECHHHGRQLFHLHGPLLLTHARAHEQMALVRCAQSLAGVLLIGCNMN